MKPVWNRITKIEERKKTSEYEGFLKSATATGSMDLDQVTCISKLGREIQAGGTMVSKEESSYTQHKILMGDNVG